MRVRRIVASSCWCCGMYVSANFVPPQAMSIIYYSASSSGNPIALRQRYLITSRWASFVHFISCLWGLLLWCWQLLRLAYFDIPIVVLWVVLINLPFDCHSHSNFLHSRLLARWVRALWSHRINCPSYSSTAPEHGWVVFTWNVLMFHWYLTPLGHSSPCRAHKHTIDHH